MSDQGVNLCNMCIKYEIDSLPQNMCGSGIPYKTNLIKDIDQYPQIAIFNSDLIYVDHQKCCAICESADLNIKLYRYKKKYYICCGTRFEEIAHKKCEFSPGYISQQQCSFINIPEIGNALLIASYGNYGTLYYFNDLTIREITKGLLYELSNGDVFGVFLHIYELKYKTVIINSEGQVIPHETLKENITVPIEVRNFTTSKMDITIYDDNSVKFKPINSGYRTKPAIREVDQEY